MADLPVDPDVSVFLAHIGITEPTPGPASRTFSAALAQVKGWVGPERRAAVPNEVFQQAVLDVASELWTRRTAPGGIATFGDLSAPIPMRLARDAMTAAAATLRPWIGGGFA